VKDSKDWIELYNPQSTDQDVSGWIVKDENDLHTFLIPTGSTIPSKGFWVASEDTVSFRQVYQRVENYSGNIPFGFGGKDQVRLYTPGGQLVDSVAYDNNVPWPADADGSGYTIVLLDPTLNHTMPANWNRSIQFGGSPGKNNNVIDEDTLRPQLPTQYTLLQNYPNPFNPSTTFSFGLPTKTFVSLKLFDLLGREVATIISEELPAGYYSRQWTAAMLSSGVYFYRLQTGSFVAAKKLVLLR